MMSYKTVVELFQKLHLQIYASQFITSQIIPLLFVLLYLESVERKGKNYKNLNISRTKELFDEIKNTSRSFWRAIIWWKKQKFDKT